MSERLNELLRQRALLQEHLAWLDREIAAEQGHPPSAPAAVAPPAPLPPPSPAAQGAATASERDPEAILAQYREQTGDLKQNVRRGCFLYFIAAFALVGLAVLALYLYSRSRH